MAIRFNKYKDKSGTVLKAIRINEKNVEELVAYINKNGGTAVDETRVFYSEDLKDGQYTAVKLSLVQKNKSRVGKIYRGVRKAFAGDIIVRYEVFDEKLNGLVYEFSRLKNEDFGDFRVFFPKVTRS